MLLNKLHSAATEIYQMISLIFYSIIIFQSYNFENNATLGSLIYKY